MAGYILLILLMLLFSALVTAAEVDYFGADIGDLQKSSRGKTSRKALQNLTKPARIMATIMVSNLISNVAFIVLNLYLFTRYSVLDLPSTGGSAILIIILSVAVLFLGEIFPRIYATQHPWQAARIMAYPLFYLEMLFNPFNKILIRYTHLISKRLRNFNPSDQLVEEISQVLERNPESESSEDKEILEGIVTFGNKNVAEIMCPRVDVVTLDARTSFTRVLDLINESGYSRIPVYEDSYDHIRGILYIKDLLPHTEKEDSFQWQKLLRTPFFVPGSRLIKDLLEDFQKNKIHMAVVVDEFGGFSGIVTLEDILEEIVGDIADEQDGDENLFTRTGEKKFLFEGKIPLDKFCKITGYNEDYFSSVRRDADTLAGLVLEINGDIPKLNDVILFGNFRFTMESVTSRRIEKIMVEYT